jgi:hypothetical protein
VPAKQILQHMAVGDRVSTWPGGCRRARSACRCWPAGARPFGIAAADGLLPSALVIWDEHPEPSHETNLLNEIDNGTTAPCAAAPPWSSDRHLFGHRRGSTPAATLPRATAHRRLRPID